ncbi:LTA synthase family protein [Clostridium botulinum]|uniref:Sulfatase domain protein n=1 Tax=Clostridium botulinum (strain Eklund 17B / Type B) TaxID=935198 RepID=B2TLT4_CLOBB|nr:sulfatase domain protein [Clostridium botulinum B str. Eklund 17B (NRP)]MBY6976697.1 sulfatase-like hydrolase/transferase [Clostridium botulinum]MBY7001370.1 sulfatase-like hydrolase/transferase [Clostridium botulinum]MCR1274207.1 LTA synthase family protein [Clostridium botulinum]NFD68886.1 LTA synthase family protein [Clostridium botulinum]
MNIYREKYLEIMKDFFKEEKIDNNLEYICKIIHDCIIGNCDKYKNIAIWGAGEHTDNLMKYFAVQLKKLKYVIENNIEVAKAKYSGYEIIAPDDIIDSNIDCVFISSFASRKQIATSIKNINKNIKIIDFYEVLEEKKIFLPAPFYMLSDEYLEIDKLLKQLNNSLMIEHKKDVLYKLILQYAKIYDFKNMFKFIDVLLKIDNKNELEVLQFKFKLEQLLKEISQKLKGQKDHLILLYIDALRYKDIYDLNNMPYLKCIAENNVDFNNAFSTSITTYESMVSCLSSQMPLENENYKRNFINEEECGFVKEAINKGYKINFYILGHDRFVDSKHINYKSGGTYSATTLWNFITDLAVEESKSISLLYFMQESHPPHIGGSHKINVKPHNTPFSTGEKVNQAQEEYSQQYYEALNYLDYQIQFFMEMLCEENSVVVFSDHGQIIEKAQCNIKDIDTLPGWHDERYKIPLLIKDKRFKNQQIDELFSLIDFNSLLIGIINGELCINKRSFIEMQFSKIHNKVIRKLFLENGLKDYIDSFKVYRNEYYKLVVINENKVRVYKLDDKEIEICKQEEIKNILETYFKEI